MKTLILSLHLLFFSQISFGQQTQTLPPKQPPVPYEAPAPIITEPTEAIGVVTPDPQKLPTKALRGLSRYTANLHLSALSSWIPMKYGISGGMVFNEFWTVEAEYTQKSISASLLSVDFGEVADRRYGLQSRWYPTSNSFHFILGLYRSEFSAELGNTILSNMGGVPSATVLKFTSYGPQLGLGNRWQWGSGVTFGIDWFVAYIPLFGKDLDDEALKTVTNQTDRSDLDKVTSAIRNLPQFDILKLTLGYTF